jgi:hypothetical protein
MSSIKKLARSNFKFEALRPDGGASRHCSIIHIVPPGPAYLSIGGRGTFRPDCKLQIENVRRESYFQFGVRPRMPIGYGGQGFRNGEFKANRTQGQSAKGITRFVGREF